MRYQPKRSRAQWLVDAPPYILACYDNGGKTLDRYTILFGPPYWEEGRNVPYLGLSEAGQGFSQWGEMPASNRRACGKHIHWLDMSRETRDHIIRRASE